MDAIVDSCRLLGDESRLRLLRLLAREELNVSELTSILGLSQPTVSRHLRLLRDAGLLRERREGSWIYVALETGDDGPAARLWQATATLLDGTPDDSGDLTRLEEVMRQRRERAASPFDDAGDRLPVPGRSWIAWARALVHLLPPLRVVDVGAGDGGIAIELARFARQVIAVDRSRTMLARVRQRAEEAGLDNVRCQPGAMEALPLADRSVDLCLLSQILHHAAQPQQALDEAARVLAPGGRLLLVDLLPHQEEWVRGRLGDQWLGFTPEQLSAMIARCGLVESRVEAVPGGRGEPFGVLIASAVRA
jgi:ArsR family transcriptional regulator